MAQDYDKIVKENFKPNINSLLEIFFDMRVSNTEPLEIRLQHTLEKEPDFLFKVLEKDSKNDYAVQVEFQASDKEHKDYIVYRCLLYKSLILIRERIPTRQFIVYMGNETPTMNTEYKDNYTSHKIELIILKDIDYELFLHSKRPELVVFAILADYKNQNPTVVVGEVITELQKLVAGEVEIQKYASQLRILSRMRKFEKQTIKIINQMPKIFYAKDDVYYQQGIEEGLEMGLEKGREEGIEEGIEKGIEKGLEKGLERGEIIQSTITAITMLLKTDFSIALISELSVVKRPLVSTLKKQLDKTTLKKVIEKFKNADAKNPKIKAEKGDAIARELLKIPSLSDEIIARLSDLKVKNILILRKRIRKII